MEMLLEPAVTGSLDFGIGVPNLLNMSFSLPESWAAVQNR